MPNTNRRPFALIGVGHTNKRAAQAEARKLTKLHPTHVYAPTPKTGKTNRYFVQRAA
jgi:hypothetical protein